MNKYRELAAAIRKGHTMIGEKRNGFLSGGCGCAIGAAWVGMGGTERERFAVEIDGVFSRLQDTFGVTGELLKEISYKHACVGLPRLAIADWLDTLEPERESDKAYAERKVSELMAIIKPEMVTE